MENRAHALAAGLFLVVLGAALAAAAFWFHRDAPKDLATYLVVTTSDISGLKVEAPVRYRGVDVGRVQSIGLDPQRTGLIRIRIAVEPATPVTRSTYAQLGFLGVTGLTFVSLRDTEPAGERLAGSAAPPAEISMAPSLMDSGEILIKAGSDIAAKADRLLNEDNQALLRSVLVSAEQMATRVARLAEVVQPALTELPALIREARGTMSSANEALAAVKTLSGSAGSALAEVKSAATRAGELATRLDALALKLDSRLEVIDRAALTMDQVGAAAQAARDETLPRIDRLADQLSRDARMAERLLHTLNEKPNSLVFGAAPPSPGPGEPGFRP